MIAALDKSALFDAMEAFWNAEPGNDNTGQIKARVPAPLVTVIYAEGGAV